MRSSSWGSAVAIVLIALPCAGAERTVHPTVTLSPFGGRETWPIAPGQMRRHEIDLQAGEFVRVTIHQEGVDVALRTVSALGVPHAYDVSDGPRGREPASLLAEVPGRYAIEVEVPDHGRGPATYSIVSEPAREANARDREWMAAEYAMTQGSIAMGGRAADSKRNRPTHLDNWTRPWFDQAARIFEARGETCWLAEARTNAVLWQTWANAIASDSDAYARLLDTWAECGDERKFDESLLWAARWYQASSRYEDAASVFDLGLRRVRERNEDPFLELQHLVGLATARGMLGEHSESLALNEEALPILRRLRIRHGEAIVLENLARGYYRQGALQPAADLAVQSARLRLTVPDEYGAVPTLLLAAEIHDSLGEPDLALRYYDEAADVAFEIDRAGTDLTPDTRAAAADLLIRTGQRDLAVERLQRVIRTSERFSSRLSYAQKEIAARSSLARLLAEEGDRAAALAHLAKALDLAKRSGDRYTEAGVLELRGTTRASAGDASGARDDQSEALRLRRSIGDRIGQASSLHELARLDRAQGEATPARQRLEEAREIVRAQRALISSPQRRAMWAATVRRIDEAYVDLLAGAGDDAGAFEASEAARARVLLEGLGMRAPGGGELDPELRRRERSLRERLTDRLDRQMRAATDDAAADAEVRDLAAEHERVRAELRSRHPLEAAFSEPEPVRLEVLRRDLLDADTALVEYFLGRDRSRAWVVTPDGVRGYELGPRASIDEAVRVLRTALERRPSRSTAGQAADALRAVARQVLDPLAADLRGRRLVVVPDGSLHQVPFAALPDRDGQPLLARFEVVNAPSVSVVALQRADVRARPRATREVAILADPVYDERDERVRTRGATLTRRPQIEHLTRGFGFQDGRLPRLPFTRREAQGIRSVSPPRSTRVALDFGANLEAVRDPELASYRYLHFATHGLVNETRPELSGIVLSLVDSKGQEQAGLLTAPEVVDLRLGAELVVLSSCRSAVGRDVQGEGVLGLTRAFMSAGVPRVVASLWPVDDLATSELMKRFYGSMLGPKRMTPAAAMRHAQEDLRRHPQWRHPYFWAGFQIQGEWR